MTNTKSEHEHGFEVAGFTSLDPETRLILKTHVSSLFDAGDAEKEEIIGEIVDIVGSACRHSLKNPLYCEFSALIIDYLLSFFLEVRSANQSRFFEFLNLLNHVPVTQESPYYQYVLRALAPFLDEKPDLLNLFNRLQMLYILTEIRDFENAEKLNVNLEQEVDKKQLSLWVMVKLAKARLLRNQDNLDDLLQMHLSFIIEAYQTEGSECALNFILRWILAINWHRRAIIKKTLLMRIHDRIGDQKNLNSAMVLYELFSMEDKLVPSSEKLQYQKKLIRYPATILNVQQLHSLYFFAGNYHCGVLARFKESIQDYQYSNYFLHKSWERLLSLSRFMRLYLDTAMYYSSMPHLDARIQELSNQVSLQNNAYVESLQANFDTIQELYEKVGELSLTDSLTGLKNRRYLSDNLFQMVVLAARHRVPVCFSMLDIDFFKLTNDTHGHQAGDFVLKELGHLLVSEFRKSDVVVRYGGEEFLVILFDSDDQRSFEIMNDLRIKIERHSFEYRGRLIPTTVSIGIACDINVEPQHADLGKCISRADSALYKAKNSGRNRVEVYKSPLTEDVKN
jgi:diguanylate cyclase (GGDEF)-like protein